MHQKISYIPTSFPVQPETEACPSLANKNALSQTRVLRTYSALNDFALLHVPCFVTTVHHHGRSGLENKRTQQQRKGVSSAALYRARDHQAITGSFITLLTVDWRCAMTRTVREATTLSMASDTSRSDSASRADVASSRIKIGGFFSTARAIATRCRNVIGKRFGDWRLI